LSRNEFFKNYVICLKLTGRIETPKLFNHPGKYFSGILQSAQMFWVAREKFLNFPKL
jgi:hypothetical protein